VHLKDIDVIAQYGERRGTGGTVATTTLSATIGPSGRFGDKAGYAIARRSDVTADAAANRCCDEPA